MKKVSLVLGIVLAASFAMAQNTATVSQTGDNGQANVTQGGGDLNIAAITQVETATSTPVGKQIATVKQTGSSNSAIVGQTETGGGGHNTNNAYIEQIGTENKSVQSTYAGSYNSGQNVWGYQNGKNNELTQTWQGGYTNSFKATMTGDRNHVIQGWNASASNGNVTISGSDNHATQGLTGSNEGYNTGINITQKADFNEATQVFGGGAGSHNNVGIIDQTNLINSGFAKNIATQTVNGYDVYAKIGQIGVTNNASQVITGNYNFVPNTTYPQNFTGIKYVEIIQTGNDNKAAQTIDGNQNQTKFTQTGNNNEARTSQIGNLSNVQVLQQGNSNIVGGVDATNNTMLATAVFNNGASMDAKQYGNNNKLYVNTAGTLNVTQDNSLAGTTLGNKIQYTQTSLETIDLNQKGDDNLIWLKNTSAANAANFDVDQEGDGNKVAKFVNGAVSETALFNGAFLDIDQVGNNNSLNLDSQSAGASVDVLQSGNGNWASVVQLP